MMERAIRPLDVNNVTQGHFTDADTLNKIIQVVTGVNDNAMGATIQDGGVLRRRAL